MPAASALHLPRLVCAAGAAGMPAAPAWIFISPGGPGSCPRGSSSTCRARRRAAECRPMRERRLSPLILHTRLYKKQKAALLRFSPFFPALLARSPPVVP